MKKLFLLLIILFPVYAAAQSNPGYTNGTVLTAPALNSAFVGKADVNNGNLTNPSITSPTIIGGTIAGTVVVVADTSGNTDASGAINTAAATGDNVYLPPGTYLLTNKVSLTDGQCLFADSRGTTTLYIDNRFSSTATAVIENSNDGVHAVAGPCIHDITMIFAQPTIDVVTTANGAQSSGATTVTVASPTNILIGGSITDATTPTALTNLTTVSNVVGNVVTLSAPVAVAGIGNGDSLHFGPSRATFATLAAGCTTGLGGTGCKYPPAISGISNGMRNNIYRIRIQQAWDGIVTEVNNVWWLDDIEMSALDKGIAMDDTVSSGTLDVSHIHGYHFWPFGISSNTNLYSQVYSDGNTYCAALGEDDGLQVVDWFCHRGRTHLTTHFTAGTFTNVVLDTSATFDINGSVLQGVQIEGFNTSGSADPNNPNCMLNVTAGIVTVTNVAFPTSATPAVCNSGGTVSITGGFFDPTSLGVTPITSSVGLLTLTGLTIEPLAGTYTAPIISITGGAISMSGVEFSNSTGSETALSITSDTSWNSIQGVNFNGWLFVPPTGGAGNYQTPKWVSYTPTVAAWNSGTITTASATGSYSTSGSTTCVNMQATVTTAGSATGISVSLPNTNKNGTILPTVDYVSGSSVATKNGLVNGSGTAAFLYNTDGTITAPVSGHLYIIGGCYQHT